MTAEAPRAAFSVGVAAWFQGMGYNVGLDIRPFDGEQGKGQAEKLLGFARTVLPATGMPFLITGGADFSALFQALAPLLSHADLVASKVQGGIAAVPLVLFADGLGQDEIRRRFAVYLELGEALDEFGPQLNLQSMGHCRLYPLLVYFDRARLEADRAALLPEAWVLRAWKHVALRAAFIDVPGRAVTWAAMTGVSAWAAKVGGFFGLKQDFFSVTPSDLGLVAQLAEGQTGSPTA